ncbi:MAG: hypothetical protein FWH37_08050 [Candidatus Bathyarchaeota archaeon]|nr:hypothetical protein [Candidatus Termiticorpusculum sp.]
MSYSIELINIKSVLAVLNTSFLEKKIGEKLKEIDPNLNFSGSDFRILFMAQQDFNNYMRFRGNFIGKKITRKKIEAKIEEQYKKDRTALEVELTVWSTIWFKKWEKRVKLLIGDREQKRWSDKIVPVNNDDLLYWKNIKHKKELIELVICTLIRNNEICGTEIIAKELIKEAFREKCGHAANDQECIFNALNSALRRAREISRCDVALIFIHVDKNYYNPDYCDTDYYDTN